MRLSSVNLHLIKKQPFIVAVGEEHNVPTDVALPIAITHACILKGLTVVVSDEIPSRINAERMLTTSYNHLKYLSSKTHIPELFNTKAQYVSDQGIMMNFHDAPKVGTKNGEAIDLKDRKTKEIAKSLRYKTGLFAKHIMTAQGNPDAHHIRNAFAVSSLRGFWGQEQPDVIIAQMGMAHNHGYKGIFPYHASIDKIAKDARLSVLHVMPLRYLDYVPPNAPFDNTLMHYGLDHTEFSEDSDLIQKIIEESRGYVPSKPLQKPPAKPSLWQRLAGV